MIIDDRGVPVLVRGPYVNATNGGGNCVDLAPAEVPEGHLKHGRGPVVAMRDSESPEDPPHIWTLDELEALVAGWNSGKFDHLRG